MEAYAVSAAEIAQRGIIVHLDIALHVLLMSLLIVPEEMFIGGIAADKGKK